MIEIIKREKDGFCPTVTFGGWKTAFISYSEQYDKIKVMKRHNLTDETFYLIEGKATCYILEDGKFTLIPLEKGKAYNVKAGTWHHLRVSQDGLLAVVENSDTNKDNTQTKLLTDKELEEIENDNGFYD